MPQEATLQKHCSAVVDCEIARSILSRPLLQLSAVELRCVPLVSSQLLAAGEPPPGEGRTWLLPEPWNGHLRSAKLLFVGQNPSANHLENYPDEERLGDKAKLLRFFEGRFDSRPEGAFISEGTRVRLKSGEYASPNKFLKRVRRLAKDVFGGHVEPGVHYALTEAVRCKAAKASDVHRALENCATKHLPETLELSGAKVIVLLGATARKAFAAVTKTKSIAVGTPFPWGDRVVVALPHPSAWVDDAAKALSLSAKRRLRAHLRITL